MHIDEIKKAVAIQLEDVQKGKYTASDIFKKYTRSRRYIGSKDRRKMSELFWGVIRSKAHLDFLLPDASFMEKIDLFESKAFLKEEEKLPLWVQCECPSWLFSHFDTPEELKAQLEEAPVILRANGKGEYGNRDALLLELKKKEGLEAEKTPRSPFGIKLKKRVNLSAVSLYKEGKIEVQDEASQLVCLDLEVKKDETFLDMCAGAGGKALFVSSLLGKTGHIAAYDISSRSLEELKRRALRAKATNITAIDTLPKNTVFDTVYVDAPCSGTGVWRRNPDSKWNLTPDQFDTLIKTQQELLQKAIPYVKPHGKLAYITCSLTHTENQKQIDLFLEKNPNFKKIKEKTYSPLTTQTDGFFFALLEKEN